MKSLGDRMKENYENITRNFIPRRTNTIIRVDGKAFHTFTRGLKVPFDDRLIHCMQYTAFQLCKNLQGAKLAYAQSDEISIWLTDYDSLQTDAWFGGNIQKMCSIAASIATANFNDEFKRVVGMDKLALFDARVFTIPEVEEVVNYFVWRQQDFTRNSVQMVARSLYSHKECENKNNSDLQDMIHEKGQNWNDYLILQKRGSCIKRINKTLITDDGDTVVRKVWNLDEEIPIFTQDRDYILECLKSD
jgi:tRNA(His) 5'-end guanylyltransferase